MTQVDQYRWWKDAIANGKRIETERGNPRSGFYKQNADKGVEVIAIYRDDAGKLQCIRTVYGDGSKMSDDAIDELFASVWCYPISEEAFVSVYERGETLPPEYSTRLTMKDQAAGVAWSPEYGKKRLGLDAKPAEAGTIISSASNEVEKINTAPDAAENPRAVIGGNLPPEEPRTAGHTIDGEQTPDKAMYAEISALAAEVKRTLEGWGGKPRSKDDADTLADYATKFTKLESKAKSGHKTEKQPFLDGGRDVDERWRQPIGNAETGKKRCKQIAQEWRDAENARRAEEARKANERAAAEAERSGQSKPEPIQAERVGGIGNMRTVSERTNVVWVVTEPWKYLAYLMGLDGELPAELVEAAGRIAQRRGEAAPGVEKRTERKAA